MKVITSGIMPDGTAIQIEDWNENYSFMPYGSTLVSYSKSKVSHEGQFSPKGNEIYRFQFDFKNEKDCKIAFDKLISGESVLSDYKEFMYNKKYQDCI